MQEFDEETLERWFLIELSLLEYEFTAAPLPEVGRQSPEEPKTISLRRDLFRRIGSYNDKNDGFLRCIFSRNCINRSRIYKKKKFRRAKERPPWKRL